MNEQRILTYTSLTAIAFVAVKPVKLHPKPDEQQKNEQPNEHDKENESPAEQPGS